MMFNRSKAQAIALLAAVFLAGGAAGWGVAAWRGDPRPPRRGPDAMVDFLDGKLHLSAAQRDSVRAVIVRHHTEAEAIWREVHPRYDSLRTAMRREINAQLNTVQQAGYARLIAEWEHQHQASDSTRRAGDTTKSAGGRN
jgi:heavy-metal resistance protein